MSHKIGARMSKPPKSLCKAGHDLTIEENVKLRRECKVCCRARVVAYRARKGSAR